MSREQGQLWRAVAGWLAHHIILSYKVITSVLRSGLFGSDCLKIVHS